MEAMVGSLDSALYALKGERVLITGHTGFKGAWLCALLGSVGCKLTGYALDPPSSPDHYSMLATPMRDVRADLADIDTLFKTFDQTLPSVVIHMAAQSLVRPSYDDPLGTFAANVMGTANVLEACRKTPGVRSVVIVTSDKCYENREWKRGYLEDDPMGGHDPYSASKGCAELVTASFRRSFFNADAFGEKHQTLVASVRSGNVIGGGDWAADRIVPDMMRAVSSGQSVCIRNPKAVRPWQHVLDPLSGYLMLASRLLAGEKEFAKAWNFGPDAADSVPVGQLVRTAAEFWPDIRYEFGDSNGPHEAGLLTLDASLAKRELGWRPVWSFNDAVDRTVRWYREYYRKDILNTHADIREYLLASRSIS